MAYDNTLQLLRSNDGLDQVKQLINKNMTQKERQEILNYLECLGRCDIVGSLPIAISTLIFEYFTPNELCQTRLVSRTWNRKVTHDSIWRNICMSYNMIPANSTATCSWNSNIPIYYDLFQRSLTMTRNWSSMKCKRIELKYHTGPVLCMLLVNPTRLLTGDIDGKIHVWNPQNEKYQKCIHAHKKHVSCLAYQGRYLASGSSENTIGLYDIKTLRKIKYLKGHDGPVTTLSFIKGESNILLSGSTDRTIRIWDLKTSECIRILHGQENTISSIIYCSKFPTSYCQSDMEFNSVVKNKTGYIISGSSDRNIFIWDLKQSIRTDTPEVISTIMETSGPITALSIYNESSHNSAKNLRSNDEYTCARLSINIPVFLAYAAIKDTTVSIYSLPGFEKTFVETPNIHKSTIWSISSAVIHSKLVTTSGDRTAIIWDLKNPKTNITLAGFDSAVVSSAISPQEELLCFGTEKGTIVLFDLMESV